MHTILSSLVLAAAAAASLAGLSAQRDATRPLVLDNVRVIDGTGTAPSENGRIVVPADRIEQVGRREAVPAPAAADTLDLSGRTVIPGLIDLHFHIENDPKLALRQLSHGVTSFRDPGQWLVLRVLRVLRVPPVLRVLRCYRASP